MGNYYQCLDINKAIENSVIEGKYCTISVPLNQNFELPSLPELPERPEWPESPWSELFSKSSRLSNETLKQLKEYNSRKAAIEALIGSKLYNARSDNPLDSLIFNLAVCIPKPCTTHRALSSFFFNMSALGFEYRDNFCRIPNDKPWVAADYVAVSIFSFIGVLTLLSTSYDIRHTVIQKKDPKKANVIFQSFSLYTNTRRLLTFTSNPGMLECLDGVRALAMAWVIVGHTFSNQMFASNPIDVAEWLTSYTSLWITTAPITVDTFFLLSGLLVVYTVAGKVTRVKLLKNLHLFYLNRLLRMFPVLAAVVLLHASLFNRVADGPYWNVANTIESCRTFWWSTLLHVQNYVNPDHICLRHSWYLAIDVQLHIISPLVLFWVLGRKTSAWIALVSALAISMVASTIYNFIKNFPGGVIVYGRRHEHADYLRYYYINTLTRASPFFVGMIYGYILHLYRGQKLRWSRVVILFTWICAASISTFVMYTSYPVINGTWTNQSVHNAINSLIRPAWALSVGWMIFACEHGYAGPINWLLSLRMWKLPARLSYAMYLVHIPLMLVNNSTAVAPVHFTVPSLIFRFLADFTLAMLVAFMITLLVDSPFSTLIKIAMGRGATRAQPSDDKKTLVVEDNNIVHNIGRNEDTLYNVHEGKTKF